MTVEAEVEESRMDKLLELLHKLVSQQGQRPPTDDERMALHDLVEEAVTEIQGRPSVSEASIRDQVRLMLAEHDRELADQIHASSP